MFVEPDKLIHIFRIFNDSNLEYVVLRDVDNEIPYKFTKNKDIDLLVRAKDKEKLNKILLQNGWRKVKHPLDGHDQIVYLYALTKFAFYTKDEINLDICFELCCKSPNSGEWLPIDQMINNSVWENRKQLDGNIYYTLSTEDELVHLMTRIIFDKKKMPQNYLKRIMELYSCCDMNKFEQRCAVVFFKFTKSILNWIDNGCSTDIIKEYYSFCDY